MKYFIFRKDENGFHDSIRSIKRFRWAIRTHQAGAKNDKEYTEGLIPFSNVVNHMLDVPSSIYNPAQFQPKIIINYLKNYKVIKDMNICPKCGELMNIVDHKASTDKVIWRCHKSANRHDLKINMRNCSLFEVFQSKINVLFFLLYFCFLENLSIHESLNKWK